MTPQELKALRLGLKMTEAEFALEMGYAGSERNRATLIRKYESGKQSPIPTYIARLAYLVAEHHAAEGGHFPDWPPSCDPNPPKPPGVDR